MKKLKVVVTLHTNVTRNSMFTPPSVYFYR